MSSRPSERVATMREETPAVRTFVAGATATQPQRFVIAEAEDIDAAQASGKWIAGVPPVEVQR